MNKIEFKRVGLGVLAATVGAAAFGAVHYMFLAKNIPAGNIMGVSYAVIAPFALGVVGLLAGYGLTKPGTMRDVVVAGSAAAIGFAVATQIGWINTAGARAGASVPARASASYPAMRVAPPTPMIAQAGTGTKMI
jgi:hypothetical protein